MILPHTATVTFGRDAASSETVQLLQPRRGLVIAAVPSIGRAAAVERPRNADATHSLYERYSAQIFGFCVNQLGSRDEAEDAVQSTFLNAHRALQRGVE